MNLTAWLSDRMGRTWHKVPPGPRGHLLFGVLRDIHHDRLRFMVDMMYQYGDVVHYRMGPITTYQLNHPDTIKHVLQDNNRHYSKDTVSFNLLRPVLGNGLLTSEGSFWLRQRRLIQPAFHRQRIAAFGTLMTEATLTMLERWQPLAERGSRWTWRGR